MESPKAPRHDIYVTPKGWKIAFLVIIPPLLGLMAWLMIYPWFASDVEPGLKVLFLLTGSVTSAFLVYAFLAIRKYKVEVFDDRIVVTGAFKTREIRLSEFRGFRILSGNDRYAQFIPVDPKGKRKKLSLQLHDAQAFEQWLDQALPNLDAQEYEQEMQAILADDALGINEEHRSHALQRAKKFADTLAFVSLGVMLWSIFHPRPYETLIWTLVLFPFLAILSTRFYPGLIQLDGPKHGARPSIATALLIPPAALAMRALKDWDILAWKNFWIPFAAFSALLFLMTVFHFAELRKKIGQMILYLAFCLVYGYAVTVCLNGLHDASSPAMHRAKILEKRISSGKHRSHYLKLSPWGPRLEAEEVDVGKAFYGQVALSDSVTVLVKGGNFRIPWFFIRK